MNGPGKVFWEKCFQGFGDFFDMKGSGSNGNTYVILYLYVQLNNSQLQLMS